MITEKPFTHFDPFSDRYARDIRNSLSEAFVESINISDPSYYRQLESRWSSSDLAPPYRIYIRDRLDRYDSVFNEIASEAISDTLIQAVIIWNEGLFFETHEQLELIWHKAKGEFREAIKGWIKAAGAYVHLECNRRQPALGLSHKAVLLLKRYGHALTCIQNLNTLITALEPLNPIPPKLEYFA